MRIKKSLHLLTNFYAVLSRFYDYIKSMNFFTATATRATTVQQYKKIKKFRKHQTNQLFFYFFENLQMNQKTNFQLLLRKKLVQKFTVIFLKLLCKYDYGTDGFHHRKKNFLFPRFVFPDRWTSINKRFFSIFRDKLFQHSSRKKIESAAI